MSVVLTYPSNEGNQELTALIPPTYPLPPPPKKPCRLVTFQPEGAVSGLTHSGVHSVAPILGTNKDGSAVFCVGGGLVVSQLLGDSLHKSIWFS